MFCGPRLPLSLRVLTALPSTIRTWTSPQTSAHAARRPRPTRVEQRRESAAAAAAAGRQTQPSVMSVAAEAMPEPAVKVDDTEQGWHSLGTQAEELRLEWTLPTGQSFRWRQTGEGEFTGVVGQRAVHLRQLPSDVQYRVIARGEGAAAEGDAAALRDYFNLDTARLADLAPAWRAACDRYAAVCPHLPGARMLRQDPVECLFQFICSSNNHISRIHGMVERLCRQHGTPLLVGPAAQAGRVEGAAPGAGGKPAELALYAFPSLEQLAAATEEQLRADGFGYRAKFVTGSVRLLLDKPEGGAAWLQGLRTVPYEEASEALCTLPGTGPKVAACVCLFSLDKHEAIPVWDLATRFWPHLRSKSLTKKVHAEVQAAFVARFGPYAGWAHNALFIAELASTKAAVPALAAAASGRAGKRKVQASDTDSSSDSEAEAGVGGASDPDFEPKQEPGAALLPDTPATGEEAAAAGGGRATRRSRRRAP